jgi:hypothetical protein
MNFLMFMMAAVAEASLEAMYSVWGTPDSLLSRIVPKYLAESEGWMAVLLMMKGSDEPDLGELNSRN